MITLSLWPSVKLLISISEILMRNSGFILILSFFIVFRKRPILSSKEFFGIFLSVLERKVLFLENIAFYFLLYLLFQKNLSFLEIYGILIIVDIYFHR